MLGINRYIIEKERGAARGGATDGLAISVEEEDIRSPRKVRLFKD